MTDATPTLPLELWVLVPGRSVVAFSVRHMLFSAVQGRFHRLAGAVLMHPADLGSATMDVRIEASSLDSGLVARDEALRSPGFLNVEPFPEIRYHSHRIEHAGADGYRVHGALTIRGVSRSVQLRVLAARRTTGPGGVRCARVSVVADIDRRDFGLTWHPALDVGGLAVGYRVGIAIEAELLCLARCSPPGEIAIDPLLARV